MTEKKDKPDGMVLIDKPEGLSSNKVVNIVKREYSAKKAGHTGTLDPFATGLLPVCLNRATRLSRYLLGKDKEYIGTLKLGEKTNTLDKTGEITEIKEIPELSETIIKETISSFSGKIMQTPPAFSALKHNGVPLYKHARKGNIIVKEPREIEIYEIETLNINIPLIEIRVKCSAGTYIRSLASDIAEKLGTVGNLYSLRRTACGSLSINDSLSIEELKVKDDSEKESLVVPLNSIVNFIPEFKVSEDMAEDLKCGKKIPVENIKGAEIIETDKPVRLVSEENALIALVRKEKNSDFFKYDAVFN